MEGIDMNGLHFGGFCEVEKAVFEIILGDDVTR